MKNKKRLLTTDKDKTMKVKAISNKNKIIHRRMAGRHK